MNEGHRDRWQILQGLQDYMGPANHLFGRLADFLRPARQAGWVVVRRLRKDAALFSLPPPKPPS